MPQEYRLLNVAPKHSYLIPRRFHIILDEPTSGLDAAAAENIMKEIVRVAKDERLIICCSIHQPSTKVYNGFDQLMILSRGREAFTGVLKDAPKYFESIGSPVPDQMNPAEVCVTFFLKRSLCLSVMFTANVYLLFSTSAFFGSCEQRLQFSR